MDIHIKVLHPQLAVNKKVDAIRNAEARVMAICHELHKENIKIQKIDLNYEGFTLPVVNISAEI